VTSKFTNVEPAKQTAIINAALKAFAEQGYDDASTNEIVKDAGISKGLLFHYFGTKKQLFLFLFDYSVEIIKTEYLACLNTDEPDLFARYRQSALLKVEIIHKHPYVFDFLATALLTDSPGLKADMESRLVSLQILSVTTMVESIDTSKFKPGIDIERALRIIAWAGEGYEKQMRMQLKGVRVSELDYAAVLEDFDAYLALLQACFYE
jgi:TetR/AcrR family transcriptional regulator